MGNSRKNLLFLAFSCIFCYEGRFDREKVKYPGSLISDTVRAHPNDDFYQKKKKNENVLLAHIVRLILRDQGIRAKNQGKKTAIPLLFPSNTYYHAPVCPIPS